MTVSNMALVKADATNRGWRSFAQGLAIDCSVGVALVLITYFGPAQGWGEVQWFILSFSVFKSVVQACCAYVLRRFLEGANGNKVPGVPLPPNPPGEPDNDQPPVGPVDPPVDPPIGG